MIPEIGRRFGPYEVLGRLGGGGMGHVFRAWDARLHREVAIKFLHNEYSMPGMRERFLREARAASALNHPNICTVFDIGEQDGDPYLVMELLQGETLKDRIDKRSIQIEEMLCVGKEVSEALGAAHAKGVIHRDVKPANIFLVTKPHSGFQAKVLDFGLAKIEGGVLGARGGRNVDITTVGSTVGTLAYMSPEQARGEVLDSRSDLFSLGVVLYEMATRQIPFPGATSALVFVKLLNQMPEPVRDWNEAIPKDLEKVISKLMAKERTQRFQTAHELYEALCKVGEKPTGGGGWLRKAVHASVPAVRSSEPIVRERRTQKRRPSELGGSPAAAMTPGPANDPAQFLRPVARVPNATPRPPTETSPETPVPAATLSVESSGRPVAAAPAIHPPTPESRPSVSARAAEPSVSVAPFIPDAALGYEATAPADFAVTDPPAAFRVSSTQRLVAPASVAEVDHNHVPAKIKVRFSPVWILGGLVMLIVLIIAVVLIINRGHLGPTMLTERDASVLTEIENRTGDKSLDGTVAQALQLDLEQSPYLYLRSPESYRIMRRQVAPEGSDMTGEAIARNTAQRLNTRAYFYGALKGTAAPYNLHVNLINTASGDVMSSVDETVTSLQEIPAAVDRLSDDLRAAVGEDGDSITRSHNPLNREATSNLEALQAFSLGEEALAAGRTLDALRYYSQAVELEPRFVQPHLRLVTIYRKNRAELAAASEAKKALAAADNTSEHLRTLAQYEYEMNASGDYSRAANLIRKLVADNQHDADALEKLARVLRLEGRMSESLQSAQQAYAADPLNTDAYTQASNALVGLDRYDAAYQLQGQEQRLGLARPSSALTAAYLEGRQDAVDTAVASFQNRTGGYRPDWNYGLYLDNIGHLAAGTQNWRKNSQDAAQMKGMESASAQLLSQGALDHALLGDCAGGLTLMHESGENPQGISALFNNGMAAALCGSKVDANNAIAELQKSYPQSFNVNSFYVADIRGALALQANDPASALEALKAARQFDLISLTPFLRGRAHVALRQGQIGIVDYQTVLAHRGVTFIVGNDVYPIAEIGVARAFADTGDLNNSAEAYRRFLDLWRTADPGQPLLAEARAHAK